MQLQFEEAMRKAGKREIDLVRETGIQQSTFWRIKMGETRPQIATRLVIARALGVNVGDLAFPADLPVVAPAFPLSIDPYVRRTLPDDEPVLLAERDWYGLVWTRELRQEWARRVSALRTGNYARGRDFNLSDVEAFLAEQPSVVEEMAVRSKVSTP